MKQIYQNFDGLDISFQCYIPQYNIDELDRAKKLAQESRHSELAYLGENNIPVMVAETGAKGGYSYRFDTELDGAIWFIAPSQDINRWNVRVSCKSLMLALHGYDKCKEKILKFLIEDLDAIFPHDEPHPKERVSRFDYCFDFISDDFIPLSECFIAHGRSKKETIFKINERGRILETITIGKMPNRQITIYNKRKEIISTAKAYWWDIWGLNKKEFKGNIWRVEVRAGKKELNKWKLKRFIDFERNAGDVIISILNDNRYLIKNENDNNAARWKTAEFWEACINSSHEYLDSFISNANRDQLITGYRDELARIYESHITGIITSYSAVLGRDVSEIPEVLDLIVSDFLEKIRENPEKYKIKFKKAENRFVLLK